MSRHLLSKFSIIFESDEAGKEEEEEEEEEGEERIKSTKIQNVGGGAIAQWIRLRLPSCGPWFKFHAHYLCFSIYSKKITLIVIAF